MNNYLLTLVTQPTPLGNEISELVYGEGAFIALLIMLALSTYIGSKGYLGRFICGIILMFYGYEVITHVDLTHFMAWAGVFSMFIGAVYTAIGWRGET